jgi:Xaa-Pro aminopeptidase
MKTYQDRLTRLRARMTETKIDLVAVGPTSSMSWLAGLSPHGDERPVMMLVTQSFAAFLMPALNVDSCRAATDLPFFPWADAAGPSAALAELLAQSGLGAAPSVSIDEAMRADFALLLLDALPGAKRSFLDQTVGYLRSRKDDTEFAILKANALLNDQAMQAAFAALRVGISEEEVGEVIANVYREHGAKTEFCIVGFGANGAFPHHHTGATVLEPGMAVLIDIGGRRDGYPSDMTRVACFGEPPAKFHEVRAVVEAAVQAALAAAKPGVKAKDIDRAAREVITAAGYGANFLHRTGHGLGIDVHEGPYITATSESVLEEGNVFSIEPGIYLAGDFGIRLEDIVILRAEGAEILSALPRDAVLRS